MVSEADLLPYKTEALCRVLLTRQVGVLSLCQYFWINGWLIDEFDVMFFTQTVNFSNVGSVSEASGSISQVPMHQEIMRISWNWGLKISWAQCELVLLGHKITLLCLAQFCNQYHIFSTNVSCFIQPKNVPNGYWWSLPIGLDYDALPDP